MARLPRLLSTSVALTLAVATSSWAQVAVTACGQSFSGKGLLAADLDCTGFPSHAIVVERGTLDLGGFTLTGGASAGVHCVKPCKILGPGTITGSGRDGVSGPKVKARDATISNNGEAGIEAQTNKGNATIGVVGSTITGNAGSGIVAQALAKVSDSVVTGNGLDGVVAETLQCARTGRVIVKDSTVAGNGSSAECGVSLTCADLVSCTLPPKLAGTSSCDTSYVAGSGIPGTSWGVCALD